MTISAFGGDPPEEDWAVRPYTLTGGRTRPRRELALEALVSAVRQASAPAEVTLERRRILEMTEDKMLAIAELSAHLSLPLGVVRVLVGDLVADGLLAVVSRAGTDSSSPATDYKVLESVLNGISAL